LPIENVPNFQRTLENGPHVGSVFDSSRLGWVKPAGSAPAFALGFGGHGCLPCRSKTNDRWHRASLL
jgi:hypothetical protein